MEFSEVGAHCSVQSCNLKDFLPFTCNGCKKVFCLEHFKPTKHSCPENDVNDAKVFTCPLCTKTIRVLHGENINLTWETHAATDCDPSYRAKKKNRKKKNRCAKKGCKTSLNLTNTMTCPLCRGKFCLKHRHKDDHICINKTTTLRNAAQLRRNLGPEQKSQNTQSQQLKSSVQSTSSLAAASRRQLGNRSKSEVIRGPQIVSKQTNNKNNFISTKRAREACPHCKKRFVTVEELVIHVEKQHNAEIVNQTQPIETTDIEPCPMCGLVFPTTDELTSHFTKMHREYVSNSSSGRNREVCPFCEERFSTAEDLVNHVTNLHNVEQSNNSQKNEKCVIS